MQCSQNIFEKFSKLLYSLLVYLHEVIGKNQISTGNIIHYCGLSSEGAETHVVLDGSNALLIFVLPPANPFSLHSQTQFVYILTTLQLTLYM